MGVDFHLLRPYCLLALIPWFLLLWLYSRRRFNNRAWQANCDAALLPHILIDINRQQRTWPLLLWAVMGLLAITALAGPVWKQLEQPVFRQQSALIIVLDLSRSMDVGDIKPSRLARARYKINDILVRRKEGQTALVVYAGDAHIVSPLTQDSATIINLLKTLGTDLMPLQGSRPEKALALADNLMQQSGVVSGDILLITDSVNQDSVATIAGLVSSHGHRLSVLGVGTEQGAPISLATGGYLKDASGSIVLPKLEPQVLQQLAQQSGGRYHELSVDDADLDYLLGSGKSLGFEREPEDTALVTDRWREEGPWLLLIILPFAAVAFRRGYLLLLVFIMLPMIPPPAQALEWDNLWSRPDQRAAQALRQQDKAVPSADIFNDPSWQAAAYYRAGQFDQAVAALQGATGADDLYNKANAQARMGDLKAAVASYDQALTLAPDHQDAQYNRDLVLKQLEQQDNNQDQKQEQQQDQNQDKNQGQQSDDKGNKGSDAESTNSDESAGNPQDEDKNTADQGAANDASNDQQDTQAGAPEDDGQQADKGIDDSQPESSSPGQQQGVDEKNGEDPAAAEAVGQSEEQAAVGDNNLKQNEMLRANEQWLRRIPDDPGGLLRKKFLYEYQRKQQTRQTGEETTPW